MVLQSFKSFLPMSDGKAYSGADEQPDEDTQGEIRGKGCEPSGPLCKPLPQHLHMSPDWNFLLFSLGIVSLTLKFPFLSLRIKTFKNKLIKAGIKTAMFVNIFWLISFVPLFLIFLHSYI